MSDFRAVRYILSFEFHCVIECISIKDDKFLIKFFKHPLLEVIKASLFIFIFKYFVIYPHNLSIKFVASSNEAMANKLRFLIENCVASLGWYVSSF